MNTNNDTSLQATMMKSINGMLFPVVVKAALELDLLSAINNGITNISEIVKYCNLNEPALQRLMKTMVALELLEEKLPGNYTITDFGATLLHGETPKSMEPLVRYILDESTVVPMMNVSKSIRTGRPSLKQSFKKGWYKKYPKRVFLMDKAMENYSKVSLSNLLLSYDFSQFEVIVDVAGGVGQLLAGMLKSTKNTRGILVDLPKTIKRARKYIKDEGLSDRCEFAPGNMLKKIPSGGNLYVLSKTLNNWDDQHASAILRNLKDAMDENTKLVIVENLASSNPSLEEAFRDIMFLACTNGGKIRSEKELNLLISEAGLKSVKAISTGSTFSIIECQIA